MQTLAQPSGQHGNMFSDTKSRILAVGDCNTLGAGKLAGHSYPERLGQLLQAAVTNCGYTMSTSREGCLLLRDHLTSDCTCVIIQFGLVDSYLTLGCAPYVLNYPDNILRKPCRNILKKIKKLSRKYGLNARLGESNVVPLEEYGSNIRRMIEMCASRTVLLPETIPHHDSSRNGEIERYNEELAVIARQFDTCHLVKLYDGFADNMHRFYLDETHANADGYDYAAERILQVLQEVAGRQKTPAP
jgi:lysophospholipase L1-like esterase